MSLLTIRASRLPDLDSPAAALRQGFRAYGRFASLRGGAFWFGEAASSHPVDTATGWYWAIDDGGALLLSPRGAKTDGEYLFSEGKHHIALLLAELERRAVIRRPRGIRILA